MHNEKENITLLTLAYESVRRQVRLSSTHSDRVHVSLRAMELSSMADDVSKNK